MSDSVLLCTVGNSPQPILKAIQSISPTYVCFFCSGHDPETGMPGSITLITGTGDVTKAHADDDKPTLHNIPTLAGLDETRFEVKEVSADDLDQAFITMRQAIIQLTERFPQKNFVADYTGGTKTMTAGLVCAALESDSIALQLVSGARTDLERVQDGSESAMVADVDRLRLDRAMAPYLRAWSKYAYREAADGLDSIPMRAGSPDRKRWSLARALSRAFAQWDDFDHAGAFSTAKTFESDIAKCYDWMLPTLCRLGRSKQDQRSHDPMLLFDLWLNAERRAAQGHFDDAVARVYRLIEWTAQWQIHAKLGLETAKFPINRLPRDADPQCGQDGFTKIGLEMAWRVIRDHLHGHVQEFSHSQLRKMCQLLGKRNNSILAHGFSPIQSDDWQQIETWMKGKFLPMLRKMAAKSGLKSIPNQLPKEPPNAVHNI